MTTDSLGVALRVTAGAPVSLAEAAAMLGCEYRLAFTTPRVDPASGTPHYTRSLAEARALVRHWTSLADTEAGRSLVGARVTVSVQAHAYPGTAPVTVLDVVLVRRRFSPTGALELAWAPAGGGAAT